jgi:predicted ATPase
MGSLNKIKVEGFKSIRSMDLELNRLNIFIGANGAGKSNFFSVFRLLNQISKENFQVYVGKAGGANSLLYFGRKSTKEIKIELLFNGDIGYKCALAPTVGDTLIFSNEEFSYSYPMDLPDELPEVQLGGGHQETKLSTRDDGILVDLRHYLESWRVYHFQDTSDSARVKQTADLLDNAGLRADAANLAAFLYWLKEKHSSNYSSIVNAIRLVAPFFDDFVLEPSKLNPDKIRLEWREKGSDAYFNASALSDGTLRFICLATLLLQPFFLSTILIDEPELGLHPYALNIIADLLRGAATKTQVIVSTQSVTLINQFEPDDIIVVEREDGQSVFRRLNKIRLESWMDDYGLGDLWEKNVIGGRP